MRNCHDELKANIDNVALLGSHVGFYNLLMSTESGIIDQQLEKSRKAS
jgi:hypothetical protein